MLGQVNFDFILSYRVWLLLWEMILSPKASSFWALQCMPEVLNAAVQFLSFLFLSFFFLFFFILIFLWGAWARTPTSCSTVQFLISPFSSQSYSSFCLLSIMKSVPERASPSPWSMTVLVSVFRRNRTKRIYTDKQKDTYFERLAHSITKPEKSICIYHLQLSTIRKLEAQESWWYNSSPNSKAWEPGEPMM